MISRAEARINLDAITSNATRLRDIAGVELMAVVKADAYGHGLIPVAQAAQRGGATWLGTALLEEGLALRDSGVRGRIMSWLTPPEDRYDDAIKAEIDLSCASVDSVREIAAVAQRVGGRARLHLEVDTGMTRGGALSEVDAILKTIKEHERELHFVGIWSHFARADEPDAPLNLEQQRRFDDAVARALTFGLKPEMLHLSNSAATLLNPAARYSMVRCGIALYGLSPDFNLLGSVDRYDLTPAMTVTARLALVKEVPQGSSVSYGSTYTTPTATTVGIVPMGYADGVPRNGSNHLRVTSREGEHPVIGRVCMDQFVIDLGARTDLRAGDEITLFGAGGPSADQWGQWSQTIGYEVLTRVGARVPRHYLP